MQVVASMDPDLALRAVPAYARRVEALGYDALSVPEAIHDGLLVSLLALEHTTRLRVGTGVLVAFARSPMLVAQGAWDLQRISEGRFELGLGTQVRGNITRRFGMPWSPPAPRMRDYVGALRAIFERFQHGTPLDHRGDIYRIDRMQPYFDPGPLEHGAPPILLGAVGPAMTRVAGEVADAMQTHPTHSEPRYLREVTLPRLEEGRRRAGRSTRVEIAACPLIATGRDASQVAAEREKAKRTLTFTFSTPAYWPALEFHGWKDVGERLYACTREGRWQQMESLLDDAMIDRFVPAAPYDAIAQRLIAGWGGLADRIHFPVPADPRDDAAARAVIEALRAAAPPTAPAQV